MPVGQFATTLVVTPFTLSGHRDLNLLVNNTYGNGFYELIRPTYIKTTVVPTQIIPDKLPLPDYTLEESQG